MKVLLTGGTGFIGSAVLARLIEGGHTVEAVVRNDDAARRVISAGAAAHVHDLTDVEWLSGLLRTVDAAIHTAAPSDGSNAAFDDAVIDAVISAFSGTDKPFVHTGGIWSYGSGTDITEATPNNAPALTAWRQQRETRILVSPVTAAVIAPALVYGDGGGIPALVADSPTRDGAWLAIGTGEQHWTTVHRADLADLYVLVLEQRGEGTFIAASGDNPTVAELTAAASGGLPIAAEGAEASRGRLGEAFADALMLDQQATGALARATFGWVPSRRPLVEELGAGAAR